jgi:hypothetical protein
VTSLPGRDSDAAPILGLDVADGLGQLPPLAREILEHTGAFAVLMGGRFLDDAGAELAGSPERGINIRDAHLDLVSDGAQVGSDPLTADIGHDDRTVLPNSQLRAVPVADPSRAAPTDPSARPSASHDRGSRGLAPADRPRISSGSAKRMGLRSRGDPGVALLERIRLGTRVRAARSRFIASGEFRVNDSIAASGGSERSEA